MSGRPKGTTKSDSKKLQTYRLSAIEKYEVENLLTDMRGKTPVNLSDIRNFEFQTLRLHTNYTSIDPTPQQIKFLYSVISYDCKKFLIVKCPVIENTSKSYVMTIYNRNFYRTDTAFSKGNLVTFKVNKTNLQHSSLQDFDLIHYHNQTFKTLGETLGFLYSNYLKRFIINELIESKDIALIFEYLKITANNNEVMALEYVYNALELDLFSIEDDTNIMCNWNIETPNALKSNPYLQCDCGCTVFNEITGKNEYKPAYKLSCINKKAGRAIGGLYVCKDCLKKIREIVKNKQISRDRTDSSPIILTRTTHAICVNASCGCEKSDDNMGYSLSCKLNLSDNNFNTICFCENCFDELNKFLQTLNI